MPLLRLPAVQALLVQCAALALAILLMAALGRLTSLEPSILLACFVQGMCAAVLAWRLGMPTWWWPIHLLFAPALVLLLALRLPPWLFLLAFLAMLPLYWQTFRTRVPYYPSPRAVRDALASLLPPGPLRVVDIGSGFGGLVLDLAARRPDCSCEGIELAPLPWAVSALRARLAGRHVRFMFGDYARLDLGRYDVVFAYLSPVVMSDLWRKAQAEMRPGTLLLSHEFCIADVAPDLKLAIEKQGVPLYGWRF